MEPSFIEQRVAHNGTEFTVRELVPNDYAEYLRIVQTQQIPMKKSRGMDLDNFCQAFDKFNTGHNLNVGAFDLDNKLRSCYGMFFWQSMPYVTDLTLVVDRSHTMMFNPLKSGLVHLMRTLYAYCEGIGYFNHYSIRYAKHLDLELKSWDKYTPEFATRYERYDELFVPANTEPKWPAYWRIMQEETLPYDTIIRHTRLKQEYRADVSL